MASLTTTYDQTQLLPTSSGVNTVLTVQAASDTNRRKKYSAVVCGVMQICTGLMAFSVGVIETATGILICGITAHVGFIITVLAGAFGIQYGRTGGKCPAIASMVLSILSAINYGIAIIVYAVLMGAVLPYYRDYLKDGMLFGPWGGNYIFNHASASGGMMIFICIVNFFASIVQSACACGLVCPCCKLKNTNVYMTNQDFHQQA